MIIGTAGHIDHGKTTLVRALTGVDTDRLPEEKRRGITIELGFAPLHLEGFGPIGIVDVPGHEGFVRTMLAGATGVDLALVVIAADEGVMPQTREHLAILELLGVHAGVVALTKADAADADWMALVEEDVRQLVSGTRLDGAAIVRCSATTGDGLDSLRAALARAALAVPARAGGVPFRLPIDRAFSVKGTGTVVTGTVWSGALRTDESVRVLPAGIEARVRGIEQHGRQVAEAVAGSRAAIALAGVDRDAIDVRGSVVVREGDDWPVESRIRADVALLPGAPSLGPRTRVRLHLGTADVAARIVAATARVAPGTTVPVRIALDSPVVLRGGDRFVLRSSSPAATIGGGVVRDPSPPRRRVKPWPSAWTTPLAQMEWMLDEAGAAGVAAARAPARLGVTTDDAAALAKKLRAVSTGGRWFGAESGKRVAREIGDRVRRAHAERPMDPGVPVQQLRSSIRADEALVDAALGQEVAAGRLVVTDGWAAKAGFVPGGDAKRTDEVLDVIKRSRWTPPSVEELQGTHGHDVVAILKLLERRGDLVAVASDRYFGRAAVDELAKLVVAAVSKNGGASASEVRGAIGVTRKYLIPLLEYFDRVGITSRRGDLRVPGPAAKG